MAEEVTFIICLLRLRCIVESRLIVKVVNQQQLDQIREDEKLGKVVVSWIMPNVLTD